MFSNNNSDICSFNSNWKKKFSTNEFTTQTDTYKIVHRGLNVKKYRCNETQTDSYLFVEEDIHADVDGMELNDFIKRVTPKLYEVLLSNERMCAFDNYQVKIEDSEQNTCLYIIENKKEDLSVTNISQLSWNCNGTALAAAFGDISHNKWCVHINTGVGIFSLSTRSKTNLEDKPDVLLETTTCACCVQFHYSLTSLIAAGTHNGELVVWDRSKSDNDLVLATTSDNKVHQEAINVVLWLNVSTSKSSSGNFRLVTLGVDGTIVMWNLSMKKSTMTPLNCYNLTARDLPKSIRFRGSLSKSLCILCGAVNPNDSEYIGIGIDIGVIFICQVKSTSQSLISSEITEIKSPVESVLATISGAIHAVQWSKVIPNFFAAVAANGIIHIFNIEEKQQIFIIDPGQGYLYDISLSSLMQGMIATAGENGTIVLTNILEHDIKISEASSGLESNSDIVSANSGNTVLKCENKSTENNSCILNCVEFNNANINYLASTDINGTIYIWNLSPQFSESHSKIRLDNSQNIFVSQKNY